MPGTHDCPKEMGRHGLFFGLQLCPVVVDGADLEEAVGCGCEVLEEKSPLSFECPLVVTLEGGDDVATLWFEGCLGAGRSWRPTWVPSIRCLV